MLEVGCGEGQYAREIARRYPHAAVVGIDLNAATIGAARAATAESNLRFCVHDAREPLPPGIAPDGGFDVVVGWMVLLHLPDKAAALSGLAAALRPGGALLLGNTTDQPVWLDHPDALQILTPGQHAARQAGIVGLERDLPPLLRQAGFTDTTSAILRYLAGGATAHGQRWYRHALATFAAGRTLLVDVYRLMDAADYDRHLQALHDACVLEVSGHVSFLVTLARRGAAR